MFETVYALWYWWDGPQEGIADYRGRPHVFVSEWCEEADDYGDAFLLKPLDDDTFRLAMEGWAIWQRWMADADRGKTRLDTHPASPEDRDRHEELRRLLREPLTVDPVRARQAYPSRSWETTPVPPTGGERVVRLAAEFRTRSPAAFWNGCELPQLEVRWSAAT